VLRDREHLKREIHTDRGLRLRGGELQRQITGAARDVHDDIRCRQVRQLHRLATPALVLPEAVQAVVQVVAGRDGGEHPPHALALVGDGVGIGQQLFIPSGVGLRGTHGM
jgi:hypothetical protein